MTIAEMISAFNRRVRDGTLSPQDYTRLQAAFRGDCLQEYHIFPINATVIDLACELMERHPLRALDAVHP